jgi:hypothetical protein
MARQVIKLQVVKPTLRDVTTAFIIDVITRYAVFLQREIIFGHFNVSLHCTCTETPTNDGIDLETSFQMAVQ